MCLDQDWDRLISACKKLINESPHPEAKIFFGIKELRKADNRGIDFVIRRLKASDKYGKRIRLYGAPSSILARNPLRVTTYGQAGYKEYLFNSISVKDLRPK